MILGDLGIAVIVTSGGQRFSLSLGENSTVLTGGGSIRITMSQSDASSMGAYLLRYWRDEVADVDHQDIEALFPEGSGYLTFKVDVSMPPVSAREARRRLGI